MLRAPAVIVALLLFAGPLWAQNDPPKPQPPKSEAEEAYSQGDFEKCIEIANRSLAANPNDHVAYYWRASAKVELGQVQRDKKLVREGIEDARASLKALGNGKLEPKYYLPYLYGMTSLAQIENRPEHADTAVGIADQLVKKESIPAEQKANIYYQRAVANNIRRKPDDAVKDYQAAINLFPAHFGARVGLAESYAQANQPEKALEAFNRAVQTFPDNALVYNNRGMFLQHRGKSKEAIADFTKAIELDPKFLIAVTNRGFAKLSSGQLTAAETDFSTAIDLDPEVPLPYSLRGTCRLSQGNIEAALQDYLMVQKLDPQNPTTHADIGFAKLFAKDYAGANAEFTAAVEADAKLGALLDPWRLWSGVLAGKSDATGIADASAAKPADERQWADHLLLFLTGALTEQQLLAAAKSEQPQLQTAQQCEAYYFIAEKKAKSGNPSAAEASYRQALNTKATHLSAYRGAQFALQQFPK